MSTARLPRQRGHYDDARRRRHVEARHICVLLKTFAATGFCDGRLRDAENAPEALGTALTVDVRAEAWARRAVRSGRALCS